MLKIEDIISIERAQGRSGYVIKFKDGREIYITKRRTIPALLILLKYGNGSEADLQAGSERLPEIRRILKGKMPNDLIRDSYADANKPYSELWNEEGFVWISNKVGKRRGGSQMYVLQSKDHDKFFKEDIRKAYRRSLSQKQKSIIRDAQNQRCNICDAIIYPRSKVGRSVFSRDRVREVFDHRIPVEKGGDSDIENYQALCFYCNKSKWQICTFCELDNCKECVLAYPETSTIIAPTDEDIQDRM